MRFNNSFLTNIICSFLSTVLIVTSISWSDPAPGLKNGVWRTSLMRADGQSIVFNIQTKDSAGQKVLYVLNGSEKLLVDNIKMKGDSVFIEMPFFESGFVGKLDKNGNM